jgi:KipI family sensor histidine kinase inhibitor
MPKNRKTESLLYEKPRFLQAGDSAVTIELGNVVDIGVNEAVAVLEKTIEEAAIEGVLATIPTYRSLQVIYDPARIRSRELIPRLSDLLPKDRQDAMGGRRWEIPVCYGSDHGMDLEFVASAHNLSTDDVIGIHSGGEYRDYMIGFAPGFAYLGGLPDPLHTPRRNNPRTLTPARSVSLGGIQAAISTMPVPSGWHMLGQTPVRTYDLSRKEPFLLQTGDRIRFKPITHDEFERLDALAEKGDIIAQCEVIP